MSAELATATPEPTSRFQVGDKVKRRDGAAAVIGYQWTVVEIRDTDHVVIQRKIRDQVTMTLTCHVDVLRAVAA